MKKQRKHCSPEDRVAILMRHLLDKEPISKLLPVGRPVNVQVKGILPEGADPVNWAGILRALRRDSIGGRWAWRHIRRRVRRIRIPRFGS